MTASAPDTHASTHAAPGDEPGDPRRPKVVAFYLPQFHPVPENDAWWGAGFTEWRNVVRATPQFHGHYQPHIPGELGFYDLRLPETRVAQAELARRHGVDAFCYYHYWFSGRRILERPFDEVLASGSPDFPFCLAWANEPWTRNWDGGSQEVLIQQEYSDEDHDRHIEYLIKAFDDHRYLRIDDRPLFLIYNPKAIPNLPAVLARWRMKCEDAGVGSPLFVCFETFGFLDTDPSQFGCEGSAEFLPHGIERYAPRFFNEEPFIPQNFVVNYDELVEGHLRAERPAWPHYRCIVPNWDNTPRKKKVMSYVLRGSTPELFRSWASGILQQAYAEQTPIVFINAWNEWAEGTHLEPDLEYGRRYLEALAAARGIDPDRELEAERVPRTDALVGAPTVEERVRLVARIRELEHAATRYFAAGEAAGAASARKRIAELEHRVAELEGWAHRAAAAAAPAPEPAARTRLGRMRHVMKSDPRPGFRYVPTDHSLLD